MFSNFHILEFHCIMNISSNAEIRKKAFQEFSEQAKIISGS
jgi:hypothetical protein